MTSQIPTLAALCRLGLSVGLVAGLVLPTRADTFRTPALKTSAPLSIQGYGKQNPACLEWTNGCVLCSVADGRTACSTPGIACLPAGLTCKRKQ